MKETKIEKLILDLSNRWDCSPQEAVDRLNSMNESEINKLINSMIKKFDKGGLAGLQEVKLPNNEYYSIGTQDNEVYEKASAPGKVLYRRIRTRFPKNGGTPVLDTLITRGTTDNEYITNTLNMTSPYKETGSLVDKEVWKQLNDAMDSRRRAALSFKNGGFIDCLRGGGSVEKCKCGCDKIAKAQGGKGKLGKGIVPEVQPRGIKGLFWKPTEYPRVDGYDNFDGEFTGTRSSYYTNDGDLMQILTKKFPAGNTAKTELLIENPNTPLADSTMTIVNSNGIDRIKNMKRAKQFLPAFKKNF